MQVSNILRIVEKLESRFKNDARSAECLNGILQNKSMQALLKLHETVNPSTYPVENSAITNSVELLNEVRYASMQLSPGELADELAELSSLLFQSPHMLALMHCHDQVASKDFDPELPEPDPSELLSRDDDESVKVVRLMKGSEPLGATIAVDEHTNNVVIARILKGGAADRSGLIHVNDILVEVNKVPTRGMRPEEIIKMLAHYCGPLTFCLIPGEPPEVEKDIDEPVYVRAKFNYNPEEDSLIPCAEAGLHFTKNDVLHIVSRDDISWWQAEVVELGIHLQNYRAPSLQSHRIMQRAGLIPSIRLQNRRVTMKHETSQLAQKNAEKDFVNASSSSLTAKTGKRNAWTLLRQSFRYSKRPEYSHSVSPRNSGKSIAAGHRPVDYMVYEKVVLAPAPLSLPKEKQYFRPFVLVGPQGVGRNLLKDRLIDSNPTRYGVPVPHTSRSKSQDEEEGKDYQFVTRDFMEKGIRENMFLEYGEYKNNLYGTSIDAVKSVINAHQVCVLTPYPQALKLLWNGDLKPFVVFVKPLDVKIDIDRQTNSAVKKSLTIERDGDQAFSAEELEDLGARGRKLESALGHMFDYTVVYDNIDRTFGELKRVAFAVENEAQWIPKAWED